VCIAAVLLNVVEDQSRYMQVLGDTGGRWCAKQRRNQISAATASADHDARSIDKRKPAQV
jgi:hypothetical protein